MTLAKSSLEVAREYLELVPAGARARSAFFADDRRRARAHGRGGARDRRRGAAARAQPGRPPLDRDPEPVRRPDERDPGRAAAPLPRRRRERAAAARPLDRRASPPRSATRARHRVARCWRSACRARRKPRECGMADAATGGAAGAGSGGRRASGRGRVYGRAAGENFSVASLVLGRGTRAATCSRSTATRGSSTRSATPSPGDRLALLDALRGRPRPRLRRRRARAPGPARGSRPPCASSTCRASRSTG